MDECKEEEDKKRSGPTYFQSLRRTIPIPRTQFEQDVAAHFHARKGLPVHRILAHFSNRPRDKDSFGYSIDSNNSNRDRPDGIKSQQRGFKVQMPRKILMYTGTIFLLLPLFLFGWKETHLNADKAVAKENTSFHHYKHNRYVSWMEEGAIPQPAVNTSSTHAVVGNEPVETSSTDGTSAMEKTDSQEALGKKSGINVTTTTISQNETSHDETNDNEDGDTSIHPSEKIETDSAS
jgi:hypothetical protein